MDSKTPAIVPFSPEDRLDSWKAIALHLHRDTRTVQRWEAEGLPIYRHQHSKHGSIYAYKSEIEAWWLARRPSAKHTRKQESTLSKPTLFASLHSRLLILTVALFLIVLSGIAIEQLLSHYQDAEASNFAGVSPVTVAIVPLRDISVGSQDGALAQALTHNIVKRLRRSHSLRVTESASTPPRAAGPLGTTQAMEELQGSLAHAGDHMRITAQLVDVATQKVIWSTQFDSDATADAAFQNRIAIAIASGVGNALALKQLRR